VLMQYGRSKSNGELALDYGFVEGHSMGSSIRESLSLTLEISETDRFADDKLDIAESNGLDRSVQFDLVRGQGPPDTMLTFLRLTSLTGADAFLLEVCLHAIATHIVQLVGEMGSCTSRN
jgi:[ribulose-bisphosphate carboxylase]-lysine N-methyltransferase